MMFFIAIQPNEQLYRRFMGILQSLYPTLCSIADLSSRRLPYEFYATTQEKRKMNGKGGVKSVDYGETRTGRA
jgi:hypothetical protein